MAAATTTERRAAAKARMPIVLAASLVVTGLMMAASLFVGDVWIDAATIGDSLWSYDDQQVDHLLIRDGRLPRAVADFLVGAALAVAGAIMQAITRNPLASPGIMGLNSGASLATVLGLVLLPEIARHELMFLSVVGAGAGAALVYGLGAMSRGGLTPVRLALTGLAVSSLVGAVGNGVTIYHQLGQDSLLWYSRGTEGVQWIDIGVFLPVGMVGFVGALAISPSMGVMALGDQVATGLGQRAKWTKFVAAVVVLLLAGGAVSLAGAIGFVGLVVPHLVRMLVGWDYRVLIPAAALFGGLLLLISDIAARLATVPFKTPVPVSVVTSLIGVPFFIYLISRRATVSRRSAM